MDAATLKTIQAPLKERYREDAGSALEAEGDLDFRGTLGVAYDAPVGFRAIGLAVRIDAGTPAAGM
ncbi:hypothetical protein STAQ_22630 [Allostella sp. ATCC 35155]|nr:hypothetical protein STAQ_22630 [Stella sp. ATCC 35155]